MHSGFACVSAQENGYKWRSRWYRTPSLLHKIYPSVSDRCWYCGVKEGTSHIWWSCPLLQPFWKSVHEHISNISTMLLDFTLAQYLLDHTIIPRTAFNKSLAMHMVTSARLCIPVLWCSSPPPILREWFLRLDRTREMEELIHTACDSSNTFYTTWAP